MIFGAKWSWESGCFVSAVSNTLLLSRKQRKRSGKSKVLCFPCPASKVVGKLQNVCTIYFSTKYTKIVRNIEMLLRGSETRQLKSTHTKYQVDPSIIGASMPKKLENLGIKPLTLGSIPCSNIFENPKFREKIHFGNFENFVSGTFVYIYIYERPSL